MTSDDSLVVPPATRLIHIGPHKTGSTAIQVALHEARETLADHGVHYAGAGVRARKAGWSIGVRGRPAGTKRPPERHWQALVDDVTAAGDVRVCISNEDFGRAEPEQLRRIVDDLGGVGSAHVVAVARRLDRYLPSQWQERVKAGDWRDYETWLRAVLDRPEEPYEWSGPGYRWDRTNVWYAHDTRALVERWVEYVGADRFTLIVSDERDRDQLPRSFEGLLGLPAETLRLYPDRSNRSLSWAEVELVREINAALRQRGIVKQERNRIVSRDFLRDLTRSTGAASGPRTPPMPEWAADRIRELSRARVAAVQALGVRIVGDPDSLVMPDDAPVGPADQGPPVSAATAARAFDWVAARWAEADAEAQSSSSGDEPADRGDRAESSGKRRAWWRRNG